jgi:hypothetical protein
MGGEMAPGEKVLKERRSQRERGRMETSVRTRTHRVFHLAVHQPGGVHEIHAREVPVLGRGYLREDVLLHALELAQAADVVVERERGVALESLSLMSAMSIRANVGVEFKGVSWS